MGVLQARIMDGLQTLANGQTAPCWTLEAAKPVLRAGEVVLVSIKPKRMIGFKGGAGAKNFDWFCEAAMVIDELSYAKTTYNNIISQRLFSQLYQVGPRTVAYVEGTNLVYRTEESFPCQDCGLVLPLSRVSVDHVRPQTGGENESVVKVLRVLGLTVLGSSGTKGQQLAQGVQAAVHDKGGAGQGMFRLQMERNLAPIPTKPGRGQKAPTSHQTKVDRYSLTWEGALFYSVVKALGAEKELQVRCMHSLVNLRPVCSSCNSSRGNRTVF